MRETKEAHVVLTEREGRVLELAGSGCSNREIAALLHVSEKDVEYHVGNLLRKLGSRNRTEAVSRAYAFGYLTAGSWPPTIARAACAVRGRDDDGTSTSN
ncbi:MAG TPA: LuxR C-terminal-related transcriptional regulator [Actinomycetota bacterium]|nr:LuxR C-terminal-related transcriptional regulator [Actinomycetota bacterium]